MQAREHRCTLSNVGGRQEPRGLACASHRLRMLLSDISWGSHLPEWAFPREGVLSPPHWGVSKGPLKSLSQAQNEEVIPVTRK